MPGTGRTTGLLGLVPARQASAVHTQDHTWAHTPGSCAKPPCESRPSGKDRLANAAEETPAPQEPIPGFVSLQPGLKTQSTGKQRARVTDPWMNGASTCCPRWKVPGLPAGFLSDILPGHMHISVASLLKPSASPSGFQGTSRTGDPSCSFASRSGALNAPANTSAQPFPRKEGNGQTTGGS